MAVPSMKRLCCYATVVTVLLMVLAQQQVFARPDYPDKIPNGRNVKDVNGQSWLGVGHFRSSGGGALNPFGVDFQTAGFQWTQALCKKDSDGDGRTNGQELGDPNCVWNVGNTPQSSVVTHPGFPGDVPAGAIDTCKDLVLPNNTQNMTIQFTQNYALPDGIVTSYPRQAFDLRTVPGSEGSGVDHMAFRFEVIYGGPVELVHHILLYACTEAEVNGFTAAPKTTGGMPCTQGLVYGWAIGGPPYCLPSNIGIKLKSSAPFVLMEVHMNNAAAAAGKLSQPGFKVTVLPSNKPQPVTPIKEAHWLWLGASLNSIVIPPGRRYVEITSTYTPPPSTPPNVKLSVIATLGHGHYLARQMWVEVRNSGSVGNRLMGCSPRYDNEDQELIPTVPFLNISGTDTLVTHCVFDSTSRTTTARGGEETDDEMCFIFALFFSDQVDTPLNVQRAGVVTSSPQFTSVACQAADVTGGPVYSTTPPAIIIAHAVFGALGFGFIVPVATLLPASSYLRSLPNAKWFKAHYTVVSIGAVFGWTAFGLGISAVAVRLATSHGKLGLALVCMSISQWLMGKFRPHLPKEGEAKSSARSVWEYIHPSLGRIIVIISAAQMFLGYTLLESYVVESGLTIWKWIHTIAIFLVWSLMLLIMKVNTRRERARNEVAIGDLASKA